ncbi:MAG: HEPN domain-containing protein [Chitinispirillia bacterium]|nr:HEPN domain-containing protein [Chitinispirillia bacterium]
MNDRQLRIVNRWLDICDEDLEGARSMLNSKIYSWAGVCCHQVVEKALKAYICSFSEEDPEYTHKLQKLAAQAGLIDKLSAEQREFLKSLEPLYIQARYPTYKTKIREQLSPPGVCEKIVTQTEEFLLWIKSKLSQ